MIEFELPKDLIAQEPARPRDHARRADIVQDNGDGQFGLFEVCGHIGAAQLFCAVFAHGMEW